MQLLTKELFPLFWPESLYLIGLHLWKEHTHTLEKQSFRQQNQYFFKRMSQENSIKNVGKKL